MKKHNINKRFCFGRSITKILLLIPFVVACSIMAASKAPTIQTKPLSAESRDESSLRGVQTPFSGSATNISNNQNISSTFYYTGQKHFYRFLCPIRQFARLGFVGPSSTVKIYYSNYYLSSDVLDVRNSTSSLVDCFLFDQGAEYIIEISPNSIGYPSPYSFCLEALDTSLPNHEKYVFHQTIDSLSNVGYHYTVEYFDVSTSNYNTVASVLQNYPPSTSYLDKIDSTHWFYDPTQYSFSDNRRVVSNTGEDHYSSVAYGLSNSSYHIPSSSPLTSQVRFSGTFVSETTVVSCAHAIFPTKRVTNQNTGEETLTNTGLNTSISFYPGINDYYSQNDFGEYDVTEAYASVSYVLKFYDSLGGGSPNAYKPSCAAYDWSICLTEESVHGSKTHSCMGVNGFSIADGMTIWPYARCCGYPMMRSQPADWYLYDRTMWASYPLTNGVSIQNGYIVSNSIIISGGNSGGPLYYSSSKIVNGFLTTTTYLIGIVSGNWALKNTNQNQINFWAYFFKSSALFINILAEIEQ